MSEPTDTTIEVWKTISEAPLYSVSNIGRVRRDIPLPHHPPRILRPGSYKGYLKVIILDGNLKRMQRQVSRLVACAFIPVEPDRPCVNHKNGNPSDNRVENLEWVTHQENIMHSCHVLGRYTPYGEYHGNAKLTDQGVRQIRELLNQGMYQRDIAKMFGVHQGVVWMIKHNQLWKHVI